jgi:pimeloyl-ACP methyl ester carboxylesterase
VLVHPTGADASFFEPVLAELDQDFTVLAFDRMGWGGSVPDGDYRKTSVAEQAIAARGLMRERGVSVAAVLGVGFGAVVALEMAIADPESIGTAVLVEPPVFDVLTAATPGMSEDVARIREAATAGGEGAAYEAYLAGELETLGAGASRYAHLADRSPRAAHSFLVELPAVPAWPLDPGRVAAIGAEVLVATTPSSPPLLLEAADALSSRIPGSRRVLAEGDVPAAVPALLRGL